MKKDPVIDAAIRLAEESSWEQFSLAELADRLGENLSELSQLFRSKDDIAEAFFDRADQAMLIASKTVTGDEAERLEQIIFSWFTELAPNRAIARDMLGYKFEPGHFHLQAHGITRISRTVQWFLTAADCRATGLKRVLLETSITGAYLASFATFLFDSSKDYQQTQKRLKKLISLYYQSPCSTIKPRQQKPQEPD